MSESGTPSAESLGIPCALCGAVAMRLVVTPPGAPLQRADRAGPPGRHPMVVGSLGVRTELDGSDLWASIGRRRLDPERVRSRLARGDVRGLHAMDPELVPLYCPTCDASYCEAHWRTWDEFDPEAPSWFEERRGECPNGHERMLHD